MTKKLLEWNQQQQSLIKQGDRSSGSTPLHYAASWGTWTSAKLLLDAYEPSAYQSDKKGSFPIHLAALRNNRAVIEVLLKKCPSCPSYKMPRAGPFSTLPPSTATMVLFAGLLLFCEETLRTTRVLCRGLHPPWICRTTKATPRYTTLPNLGATGLCIISFGTDKFG